MRRTSQTLGTALLSGLLRGQASTHEVLQHFSAPAAPEPLSAGSTAANADATVKSSSFNVTPQQLAEVQAKAASDLHAATTDIVKRFLSTPLVMANTTASEKQTYLSDPNLLAFASPEVTEGAAEGNSSAAALRETAPNRLSGRKRLVIPAGSTKVPKFAVVFASVGESKLGLFAVKIAGVDAKSVQLTQISGASEGNIFVDATLTNAEAARIPLPESTDCGDAALELVGRSRVAAASAVVGAIQKLSEVASLHAAGARRYDALLCYDEVTQQQLASLEIAQYAVESFMQFVNAAPSTDGEAFNSTESVLLQLFANRHLRAAVQATLSVIHPHATNGWNADRLVNIVEEPLPEPDTTNAVATASATASAEVSSATITTELKKPTKYKPINIEYSRVANIDAVVPTLATLTGFDQELITSYVVPQLKQARGGKDLSSSSGGGESMLTSLFGSSNSGSAKLANTHINLEPALKALERDIATFPTLCTKYFNAASATAAAARNPGERDAVAAVLATILAENMASVAVAYRASTALDVATEEDGYREWLNAQAFLGVSAAARARAVRQLQLMHAANAKRPAKTDFEFVTMHPLELPAAASATSSSKQKQPQEQPSAAKDAASAAK